MLTDTHCHLDFESFDDDRKQVLDRSRKDGIERILVPGINLFSCQKSVDLTSWDDILYAAVGYHPNEINHWDQNSVDELRRLATHSKVVAIGEIGLDYFRDSTPRGLQRMVFEEQLNLAQDLELPVVIHNRQASEDLISILRDWHAGLKASGSTLADRPGVLHSFSEEVDFAHQAFEINFYVGISGPVTFQNARKLQKVVTSIPLDKILIETDAPFLTPHPFRGKRNEPSYVRLVANQIAELQNETLSSVAQKTTINANMLFEW
ncbi:MAG: TatD family hydrolase [Anaerolineales bacterium]|nr:TatD family hydrolase [Anaerolineales bacterium]